MSIQVSFTVSINTDGSISTQAVTENVERSASTYDIYQASKRLYEEIDTLLLAERISNMIINGLTPKDPSTEQREKIAEALSERGIDPTKAE